MAVASGNFLLDGTIQGHEAGGEAAYPDHQVRVVLGVTQGVLQFLDAEGEPGRDLPGTLVLPDGTYNVSVFLTEESFHVGMVWATVMTCDDLVFTVAAP